MGITVVPVSDEAMQMYNMPAGAFVYEVEEGSAAEAAGLKKGDIITKLEDISIDSSDALVDALNFYEVGETVTVEIQEAKDGSYVSEEVEVTPQEGAEATEEETADAEDGTEDTEELPYDFGFPYDGGFPMEGDGQFPDGLFDYFYDGQGDSGDAGL